MNLTPAQLLLLNNLMYLKEQEDSPLQGIEHAAGISIGEFVSSSRQHPELLDSAREYGAFVTGEDWQQILNAVRQDSELCELQIREVHRASTETGEGLSVCLVTPDCRDAILVFKGTEGPIEWSDNFFGGGRTGESDGVSTPAQLEALAWAESLELSEYRTVTVTGHSKGGNKAKYLTLLCESVTRGVAFDGQGFSDEFMETYRDRIRSRQYRIQNYNAASDYVNLLLNDVGSSVFCRGFRYGRGRFLENHCPDTMLYFGADGKVFLFPDERDPRMIQLDQLLNRSLRTLSEEQKPRALRLLGELVEAADRGESIRSILHRLGGAGELWDFLALASAIFDNVAASELSSEENGSDRRIPMPMSRSRVFSVRVKELMYLGEEIYILGDRTAKAQEHIQEVWNGMQRGSASYTRVRLSELIALLEDRRKDFHRQGNLLLQIADRYLLTEP